MNAIEPIFVFLECSCVVSEDITITIAAVIILSIKSQETSVPLYLLEQIAAALLTTVISDFC